MNLFQASNQWATRPDDERFWTLEDAYDASLAYARTAVEKNVKYADLRVEAADTDVVLVGKTNVPARLTNWAFGQLSARVGAPASFLRQLPPTLAAQNLNHLLKVKGTDLDEAQVLFHRNGNLLARAFTSDIYGRYWNHEVIGRARGLENRGWRVPPARPAHSGQKGTRIATAADILSITGGGGLSVNVGDEIGPSGIYVSDHDCFLFLINEAKRIDDGTPGGLSRGIFIKNSEVGASYLWALCFYFRHVCGNHIVWGAENVIEIKVRHVGDNVGSRFSEALVQLSKWADTAASVDEARIKSARSLLLGADRDAVLDVLFGKKSIDLTRRQIEAGYDSCVPELDGDPRSAWGIAQGLTRSSQLTSFADERDRIDRAAGKIVEFAF